METPTCQVPKNVLLVVVVWCLRCNDSQKEGVRKKEMKTELMTLSVRIGRNTFHYHYIIFIICYYY